MASNIAFSSAIAFLAGVLAASLGWNIYFVFASASLFGGIIFVRLPTLRIALSFAIACTVALCFGILYYRAYIHWRTANSNLPFGKEISFAAVISDEPKESSKYLLLEANALPPLSGSVTIFIPLGGDFAYGDEVKIRGKILAPQSPVDDPAVFPDAIYVVAQHQGFWLREALINFKLGIFNIFSQVLPSDEAALLGGETIGGTTGMSAVLKEEMSASGTSYLISMYGYKLSMIVFMIEAVLSGLIARRARFCLLVLAVVLFSIMAGGDASAVRAAIMIILALSAKEAGRIFDPGNAIAFTASGMVFWDPTLLVQPAFELSFLSILGIFYLILPLKKLFGWVESDAGFLGWREAVVVAVASLLPIIPIISNAFGDFSLSAFPSNILVFPAVLPTIFLGCALAAIGAFMHWPELLFAKFIEMILLYQLAVIKIFAAISVPLPFQFDSWPVFAFYYSALAVFTYVYA